MKLQRPTWQPVFLLGLLLIGCRAGDVPEGAPAAETGPSATRDTALAVLSTLRRDAFSGAFAALSAYRYTRYSRTEQLDAGGRRIAFAEQVVRHAGPAPEHIRVDSGGTFDFGFFRRFVSPARPTESPRDLSPYLLAEEPAFLSPRNRDAFSYRLQPDTLIWDRPAQVVEVRARPVAGEEQRVRMARLYLDRATGELIALAVARLDPALLFREESRYFAALRPVGDSTWVPHLVRFHTRLHLPLLPPRQFRIVSAYYAFAPGG
ncbi:hypothetical protein GQ464_016215 [Rhodocaloribacter litoris]|uniref:hypothetical protein n=1 Tax=Rhodocaloribacter litoris TaxID=2558931 RepID=UPI0014202CD0|nr:hypothetical protein [Rhodocaloribacter litoris]QXD14941.1 hypothetical protein GQ464_016215 [Rhodocaloribacter litoris]